MMIKLKKRQRDKDEQEDQDVEGVIEGYSEDLLVCGQKRERGGERKRETVVTKGGCYLSSQASDDKLSKLGHKLFKLNKPGDRGRGSACKQTKHMINDLKTLLDTKLETECALRRNNETLGGGENNSQN